MVPSVHSTPVLGPELHAWLARALESELELPLLPDVAARIVAICDDDETDARDVQVALERDPSLASNVLRIANSVLYAPKEPIVSLQQAVHRLGLLTVRSIALSASTRGRVFRVPGHEDRVRAIWHHSVVAAAFARELARRLRRNVEGAFLGALLHDVGRPVVLQTVLSAPESLAARPLAPELLEAAMSEFHARVGGKLVKAWRLPEWTAAAVTHHHQPDLADPFEDEARSVRLADLLAHWALEGDGAPESFPLNDPVIGELELYREDVELLLAQRDAVLASAEALR